MKKVSFFILLLFFNFLITASQEEKQQTIFSPALSFILKTGRTIENIVANMRSDKTYCVHHKGKKLDIFRKMLDDESDAAKTNNFYLYENISTTNALLYMAYAKLLLEKKKDELTDKEKYLLSLPGAMSGYTKRGHKLRF